MCAKRTFFIFLVAVTTNCSIPQGRFCFRGIKPSLKANEDLFHDKIGTRQPLTDTSIYSVSAVMQIGGTQALKRSGFTKLQTDNANEVGNFVFSTKGQ